MLMKFMPNIWADLTDRKGDYGVSVLNDCKYGWINRMIIRCV